MTLNLYSLNNRYLLDDSELCKLSTPFRERCLQSFKLLAYVEATHEMLAVSLKLANTLLVMSKLRKLRLYGFIPKHQTVE